MSTMTELLPPANWYADPDGSGRWRYWDGAAWTEVFLNQDEPGPSVWAQYWELVRPWIFALVLAALAVSLAHGDFGPWFVVVLLLLPQDGAGRRSLYGALLLAALGVGTGLHSGWAWGLGVVGCAMAAVAAGHYRERLPQWFVWTVLAFGLSGFGVLLVAGSDLWRG